MVMQTPSEKKKEEKVMTTGNIVGFTNDVEAFSPIL